MKLDKKTVADFILCHSPDIIVTINLSNMQECYGTGMYVRLLVALAQCLLMMWLYEVIGRMLKFTDLYSANIQPTAPKLS